MAERKATAKVNIAADTTKAKRALKDLSKDAEQAGSDMKSSLSDVIGLGSLGLGALGLGGGGLATLAGGAAGGGGLSNLLGVGAAARLGAGGAGGGAAAAKGGAAVSGAARFAGPAGLVVGAGLAGKALLDLGSQVDEAERIIQLATGATGAELQALSNVAVDLYGETFQPSIEALGDLIGTLATTLPDADMDSLAALGEGIADLGYVAGVSGDQLGALALDLTTVGKLWGLVAEDYEGLLDDLLVVSQEYGVPIEKAISGFRGLAPSAQQIGLTAPETVGLVAQAFGVGVEPGSLNTGFQRFVREAHEEGADPRELLSDLFDRARNVETDAQQTELTRLFAEYFGTRGSGQLLAAVQGGGISLEGLDPEAEAGALDQAAEEFASIGERFSRLIRRFSAKIAPLAEDLLDIAESLFATVEPWLTAMVEIVGAVFDGIRWILQKIGDIYDKLGPLKWGFNKSGVGQFLDSLSEFGDDSDLGDIAAAADASLPTLGSGGQSSARPLQVTNELRADLRVDGQRIADVEQRYTDTRGPLVIRDS